ncbi:hypothetical protein [Anaerosporobacter sp.]
METIDDKSMKKKCLPLVEPAITTNPYVTNKLAILGNFKETQPWILQNFTNIWMQRNFRLNYGADFLYFSSYRFCPFIKEFEMCTSIVDKKWKTIVEAIIDIINMGHYVYLNINTSFIPQYKNFENNQMHDIFVYGYDRDEKILYVADFFEYGKYGMKKVCFKDFIMAYDSMDDTVKRDFFDGIIILQYTARDIPFDMEFCIQGIRDYLNSKNTIVKSILVELDKKDEVVFGINTCDIMIQYLQDLSRIENIKLDYRTFHYFYQHKVLMRLRIQFFIEKGYVKRYKDFAILDEYLEIERKWLEVRNRILKYNIKPDYMLIERTISDINSLKKHENKVLKHLLNVLKI